MPAKRRIPKKAAPKKVEEPEPEVVEPEQEEIDLNETDNINEHDVNAEDDEEEADEGDDEIEAGTEGGKKGKKPRLTVEEKIQQLDKLSKAHPFGLLMSLTKLQNKLRPAFTVSKIKDNSDEVSCTARYGELKIIIPKIPSNNLKYAKKVSADLILSELYGEVHEIEEETQAIKDAGGLEVSTDEEWYKEKKTKIEESMSARVDKMATRINENKNYNDEEKATRLGRIEKYRKTDENLPDYDDVYRPFDNPYFRVLHNAIFNLKRKGLDYELSMSKIIGEKEVVIPTGKDRKKDRKTREEEKAEEAEETGPITYKVNISIVKSDVTILELKHEQEADRLGEAKSEAAYKVLEKLLQDDVLFRVTRNLLRHRPEVFERKFGFGGRPIGRGRGRSGFRGGRGRGRGGFRGGRGGRGGNRGGRGGRGSSRGQKRSIDKHDDGQAATNGHAAANGHAAPMQIPGQMMMMPVMMGPNGQYMVASNAQPMMMMPVQNGGSPAPAKISPAKRRRGNSRR